MNAKEYLKKIKYERERIRQLEKLRDEIQLRYTGISGIDYSAVKINNTPENKMEKAGWELLENREKINKEIERTILKINEIHLKITKLENPLYSHILFARYSEYKTFEQMAVDMGYSYHYICHLHGEALLAFNNIINV